MMRLFEFIVALVMVAILGIVVGVFLPSSGHVERSVVLSKDIRDVYDLMNNFHRFPEYATLRAEDPTMKYSFEGKAYGPGAAITWSGDNSKVGQGRLEIASAKPGYEDVGTDGHGEIVWNLTNGWHGTDKHFTIDMERTGRGQKLVKVTWSYDVTYGWNLINRYSSLYIHGAPDELIQYSLDNLQNVLASVPNIDYSDLRPAIVQTTKTPVLFVSTEAKRTLDDVDAATSKAMDQLNATMKKLGVHQVGPRITFTTNYGNDKYSFDVAVPIDSDTLKIGDQQYTLQSPVVPKLNPAGEPADDSSVAGAGSTASAASAPASADSVADADSGKAGDKAKKDQDTGPKPGSTDKYNHLIVNDNVKAMLAFGGKALTGTWTGSPAGVPPTRLMLEAYALTHGYKFDDVQDRLYDKQLVAYGSKGPDGKEVAYDQQKFAVFLPLTWGPDQTPEQQAGTAGKHGDDLDAPAAAGSSAPASAGSVPAPAGTAPSAAGSAPTPAESAAQ
ncbi:polyketide cyclase [Oleiagrimonas sp. C23AA]|uniref:polyketide cyclase n=1 Tax=Oleiagrimonas sp. C23AA TaxID=2719047 RepID=UPI0014221121|nr:polyketide cyclase [Oleiagrimonas sp. C23AA]NII11675.1 polyketide cyclase [Oleiagrimonas sp. C23AA]